MTTYTTENYDKSVLPGTFRKDLRDSIGVAVTLGWKVIINRKQTVNLVSYDGAQTERIGVSNAKNLDIRALRRKIIKYADPELREAAADFIENGSVQSALGPVPAKAVMKEAAKGIVEPEPEPEPEKPLAYVVHEGPMVARGGAGRGYESPTTIERKWSDGSRDYKCVGCEETSPERLSISRHYANVHSRGKGRQPSPPEFKAEVDGVVYRPSKRRIEALAEIIAALIAGGEADPLVLAQTALTWVHEQHGTHLSTEAEPLSPEETLNRIRQLLDDGTMAENQRQVEALTERVVEAETRATAAEAKAAKAEAHAARARETLQAFTDLAADLAHEEETG